MRAVDSLAASMKEAGLTRRVDTRHSTRQPHRSKGMTRGTNGIR